MCYKAFFFLLLPVLFLVHNNWDQPISVLICRVQKQQRIVHLNNLLNNPCLDTCLGNTNELIRKSIEKNKEAQNLTNNSFSTGSILDSTIVYFKSNLFSELKKDFHPTVRTALEYIKHSKTLVLNLKSNSLTVLRWSGLFAVSFFKNGLI
jgi:hypothetical protein